MKDRLKLSIFLFFITFSLCIEDYYKLLGVSRKATQPEIRRAFKKLALKYHPDKTKDKSDNARDKFAKIANAYETLNDQEKRKEYDDELDGKINFNKFGGQGGGDHRRHHSGFNSNFGGGDFEFGDIFGKFFNNDNSGFNFGGGGHNKKNPKPFENTNVITLKMNNMKELYKRKELWFVLFYKTGEKNLVDVFKSLANKSLGLFKVAAVNCEDDEEICEEFNISKIPIILYFPDNSNDSEEAYKGQKNMEDIFAFGTKNMQNFVKKLDKDNSYKILNFKSPLYKIILFTTKNETPPLFKVLSKSFREKLIFLEIQDKEKELVGKFRINRFPTILALTDVDNYKGDIYKGHFKKRDIEVFLQKYADKKIDNDKKANVIELTEEIYKKNNCNQNDVKNICIIYLNKNSILKDDIMSLLTELSKKYINDPFKFYFVNLSKYNHFLSNFENINNCNYVAVKGKRRLYKSFCGENQGLNDFLDEIVSGSGNFIKLKNNLFTIPSKKGDL